MSFNHIPTLSKKNVEFINNIIEKENIDLLIEYGSGISTLFFLSIGKFDFSKLSLNLSDIENALSLNLSSNDLIKRYNVMNHMVIEEIKNANNKKVVNFLKKRRQFLADEAMRMIVSKEVA